VKTSASSRNRAPSAEFAIMLAAAVAMQDGEIKPQRPQSARSAYMCLRGRPWRCFDWFAVREREFLHVMVFDGDECIYQKRGVRPTDVFLEFMHEEDKKERWRRMCACIYAQESMPA